MLPISGRLMGCNHAETGATATYKQRRDPTVTNVFTRKKDKRSGGESKATRAAKRNQQPKTEMGGETQSRSIIPNRPPPRKRKPPEKKERKQ